MSDEIGFVGYRNYKESDMYKRYQAARAAVPQKALGEVMSASAEKNPKKKGVGCAVCIIIFGLLYLAIGVVGYFLKPTGSLLKSIFAVYGGRDCVRCVLDVIGGDLSDIIELAGCGTLLASELLAFCAFIGGIVCAARGKGIGKLMKTGCSFLFLFIILTMAVVLIERDETTIGLAASVILGGVIAVLALAAPCKEKENK